ncbi:DUF423 domain-containing protein [Marinobacter fonticola]|uniref:DUF423 domain-containing protein n=1 Tax=Marinobacter fonticola TaxID=2603215 RepID=UPI0011E72347|nr:DUF423 domain-containing protein [Marinobacter fonticola]
MRWVLVAGALAALTGVMAGAFGAHGLRQTVSARDLEVFQTGITYQIYHALALLAVATFSGFGLARRWLAASAILFILGILLFSGSLYGLVLMDIRALGPVTPIGGLCFMAAWVSLIIAALKRAPESG